MGDRILVLRGRSVGMATALALMAQQERLQPGLSEPVKVMERAEDEDPDQPAEIFCSRGERRHHTTKRQWRDSVKKQR